MDRRMFLRSALVVAGSATTLAIVGSRESQAASLMDQLANPAGAMPGDAADMPAEGSQEAQYTRGRNNWGGRPGWRRRGWRRRGWARRCWWRVNRWGRRVRVCAW